MVKMKGSPNNKLIEFLAILYTLSFGQRLGRYFLKEATGLGEGVLRRILSELSREGYISVKRGGTVITDKGREFLSRLIAKIGYKHISPIDVKGIVKHSYNAIAGVTSQSIKNVVQARDCIVRSGCLGGLILFYTGSKLVLPPMGENYLYENFPSFVKELKRIPLEEGDYIVISFGGKIYSLVKGLYEAVRYSGSGDVL